MFFSIACFTISLPISSSTHHFAARLTFNITRLSSIVAVIGTYVVKVVDGKDGFAVRCVDVELDFDVAVAANASFFLYIFETCSFYCHQKQIE